MLQCYKVYLLKCILYCTSHYIRLLAGLSRITINIIIKNGGKSAQTRSPDACPILSTVTLIVLIIYNLYFYIQILLYPRRRCVKALSHGTRQSRVSSSFSMGDMRKAANRKRFCWRRGGGAQAVLVHPKSCRVHEHGASRQAPPKIKIFYLFVSGSGSRVGFNQSEN